MDTMVLELKGDLHSGKTDALVRLFKSYEAAGMAPVVLLPTERHAAAFADAHRLPKQAVFSSYQFLHLLPTRPLHRAVLIDELAAHPAANGCPLELVRNRLSTHTSPTVVVYTTTAGPRWDAAVKKHRGLWAAITTNRQPGRLASLAAKIKGFFQ